MRPIDADAAANAVAKLATPHLDANGNAIILLFAEALRDEKDFPTLDYAPVIHAHWIPCVSHYECSRCHNDEEFCEPYCHCGAKMDGKDGEQNG